MTALTVTPSWRALAAHHTQIKDVHLRNLFADDPGRAERFCAEGAGPFLDYSSAFMQAFSAKGRFAALLRAIPVHVVMVNAALLGAAI